MLCVDLLIEAGENIDIACGRVAREARICGLKFPGDNDTKTLKEWRYEKSKWAPDSEISKTYYGVKAALDELRRVSKVSKTSPEKTWSELQGIVKGSVENFILAEISEVVSNSPTDVFDEPAVVDSPQLGEQR